RQLTTNMSILTPFKFPTDIRWRGIERHHHKIFLVKSVLLILFSILVIAEYSLFKSWWENGPYDYHKDWTWAPYQFWLRIGIALIPDILVTLLTLILLLNPLHHATYSFHPVFALVSSFCMFGLYVGVCFLNPLFALSNEVAFHNMDIWERIVFVETGFEGVICLCWVGMMGLSAVAVHRWRVGRRGWKGIVSGGQEEERV
ncbi:hypothetical protein EK21DRAFT_81721, partial [Setomelanomma holmii]